MELWAVVGLAGIDEIFRKEIMDAATKKDEHGRIERKALYKYLGQDRHFRLSRYEVEELRHFLMCEGVTEGLAKVGACWDRTCSVGQTFKDDYRHPDPGWKGTYVFAIDAQSGDAKRLNE